MQIKGLGNFSEPPVLESINYACNMKGEVRHRLSPTSPFVSCFLSQEKLTPSLTLKQA